MAVGYATAPAAGAASSKAPVSVGMIAPLTGNSASNGQDEVNGFKLALSQVHDQVDGHRIEFTALDGQLKPTVSLNDAKELIQSDHVQLVEGSINAAAVASVSPYVQSRGVPIDDIYLATPQQMDGYQQSKLGETSGWDSYQPASVGAKWAYQVKHWKHMTLLATNYSFGWEAVGAFISEYTHLGGKVDKVIWVPANATTFGNYMSQIPANTSAVWAEMAGALASNFVDSYSTFGLKNKIPLMGLTTLTDQSALPAMKATAAVGVYADSQYCDGLTNPTNVAFVKEWHKKYGGYPAYYSEAGYTKAQILIAALRKLHGQATNPHKLEAALRSVKISAPRGPVSINKGTWSPTENAYICVVKNVGGVLRNVPIKTYKHLPPWGILPKNKWKQLFAQEAVGPPSATG